MKKIQSFVLFLMMFSIVKISFAQKTNEIHVLYFDDFESTGIRIGFENTYGDKFLLIGYNGNLVFPNDTLTPNNIPFGALSLIKMNADGSLEWHQDQKGNAFYSKMLDQNNDVTLIGRFNNYISWGGDTLVEDNDNGPNDYQYFLLSISKSGIFNYIRKFPKTINEINDVAILEDVIYIGGDFDSLLICNSDTLIEDSISLINGDSDIFIAKLDSNNQLFQGVNIGSSTEDYLLDLDVNSISQDILLSAYYFGSPNIDTTISTNGFSYVQLDSFLNLVSSRSFNAPLVPPFATFNYGINNNVLNFEKNDTIENVFSASIKFGGPEYLGYYKYINGVFSPLVDGIAFGGNQLSRYGNEINHHNNVIAEHWNHPNGIALDNSNFNNNSYSFSFIDMDSLSLKNSFSVSNIFQFNSFQNGSLCISSKLMDSLTFIDTIEFIRNTQKNEFIIANLVNCSYFNPEVSISIQNDSLVTDFKELDILWYYNGNQISGAMDTKIKIQGKGVHYAEFSNYYGCTQKSNEIDIVSGFSTNLLDPVTLNIYPNPTDGLLTFSLNTVVKNSLKLIIYDVNGKLLDEFDIDSNSHIVNVSDYIDGIYFYEMQFQHQVKRGKFVKE
jgi:hypothetical protein